MPTVAKNNLVLSILPGDWSNLYWLDVATCRVDLSLKLDELFVMKRPFMAVGPLAVTDGGWVQLHCLTAFFKILMLGYELQMVKVREGLPFQISAGMTR